MNNRVVECEVNFLSFARACKLVPTEFLYAYQWFQEHEGEIFSCLPMGSNSPNLPVKIKLAQQAGIHTPSYSSLESKGEGKPHYALFIHSQKGKMSSSSAYSDMDVIKRPDGTWTLDYCAHKSASNKTATQSYNGDMMNNLRDGVPVAVYVNYPKIGYINYGLAFVERYDALTEMFTLHGPVTSDNANDDFFSIIPNDQLTEEERLIFQGADGGDDRKKSLVQQVRRERQGEFRRQLMVAYSGACAATGTDVPAVLQAAHIDPYRGRKSQVASNGMLLRADIHLLYDAHLITVLPEKNTIRVGKQLKGSYYWQFDRRKINIPSDPLLRPNDVLLEMHMREFESIERHLVAG